MSEGALPDIDVYGLTGDDWNSFTDAEGPGDLSRRGLLWWALVGGPDDTKEGKMSGFPMQDLFTSVVNEARALAKLAASSSKEDIRELAPMIKNLLRKRTLPEGKATPFGRLRMPARYVLARSRQA